jgi:hypothetical protein
MRRSVGRLACSTTLVLVGSALLAGPADAMRETGRQPAARGGLSCPIGVVGFDSGHHVRSDNFTNGRLEQSRISSRTLPFDVTAWGYYDQSGTSKRNTLRLNVVAADGIPRKVVLKRTPRSVRIGKVTKYQGRSFTPKLYADGGTFYAYAVSGGVMKRWSLTRYRDGDVRFAQPVKVGGFRGLTSLQAASITKVRGVESEILYATTDSGQLLQIVVPFEHPNRARKHKLARSGFEGVTELAWSLCNDKRDHHTLIAIDPVGNRATWTTIKRAFTRPKAKLRGDVTGVTDWHLTAGF